MINENTFESVQLERERKMKLLTSSLPDLLQKEQSWKGWKFTVSRNLQAFTGRGALTRKLVIKIHWILVKIPWDFSVPYCKAGTPVFKSLRSYASSEQQQIWLSVGKPTFIEGDFVGNQIFKMQGTVKISTFPVLCKSMTRHGRAHLLKVVPRGLVLD